MLSLLRVLILGWCCREHEELFDQAVEIVGTKKFEQQKQYVQGEVAKQVYCFTGVI